MGDDRALWRERFIKAGLELIERGESLKARGLIEDYMIVRSADDPEIVDHITLIKRGETTWTLGHGVLPGAGP
jgi:hypothetical protein